MTAYVEWVLGNSRSASAPYVVTEIDHATGAVFARSTVEWRIWRTNCLRGLGGRQNSYTGDRTEFLGRNGTPEALPALERGVRFHGKVGAGLDPCAALQTVFELRPGARVEIVFFLGQAENRDKARELVRPLSRGKS